MMETLKRAIESEVGREIERLVERRSSATGCDELLERLAPSETWRRFRRRYILNAFDTTAREGDRDRSQSSSIGRLASARNEGGGGDDYLSRRFSVGALATTAGDDQSLTSIGSISSISTTDTVIVFGDAELAHVCELLAAADDDDNDNNNNNLLRLQGLDMLARASNVDGFIRSEEWGVLEKLLRACLFDDNSLIRSEATCVYRMLICSSDDRTSLTAYTSLLRAVCNFVGCRAKTNASRLRQAVYLLDCINDYHKECIAHRWLRTPTHMIAAFVRGTLDGLADRHVWTLLAGVDPTAAWLQSWLAAAPVRSAVMAEILDRSLFLQIGVARLADDRSHKTVLLYSCCVLLHFLRYEQGRHVIDLAVAIEHIHPWFTVLINCIKVVFQFQPDPSLKDVCLQTVNAVTPYLSVDHQCEFIHLSVSLFPRKISTDAHLEQFDWASSFLLTLVKSPPSRHVIVHSFIKDHHHVASDALFQVFRSSFKMKNVHVSLSSPVFYLGLRKIVQACSHIFAHPLFLLHYHLPSAASLAVDVLSLDALLPRGFIIRMSLTSIGHALWRRGVLEANSTRILDDLCRFEGRVSETLMIANFIAFVPAAQLPAMLEKVGMHVWKRHASDEARLEALLCIFATSRNVELILECVADSSTVDRNVFRDILLLPANKRLSEDQLVMALTVLSVICASLPSLIFIQQRFQLVEALRNELLNHVGDEEQYVVDEVSHHVDSLISRVRLLGVGDHTERHISVGSRTPSQLRSPKNAVMSVARASRMNTDLSIDARCFDELVQDQGGISRFQFEEIFSLVPEKELRHLLNDVVALEPSVLAHDENIGLQVLLAYNKHVQLIMDRSDDDIQLEWTRVLANGPASSGLQQGLDFILASLFLLCRGNVGLTLALHAKLTDDGWQFAYFPFAGWPDFAGDDLEASATSQALELIVFNELPQVHFAMRRANYLLRNVVAFWLGQSFWNILDVDELATLLAICLVHGSDHLLYACVAILRHLQDSIVRWSLEGTLRLNLRLEPIAAEFKCSDHLEFCHGLRKVYRKTIRDAMKCSKH